MTADPRIQKAQEWAEAHMSRTDEVGDAATRILFLIAELDRLEKEREALREAGDTLQVALEVLLREAGWYRLGPDRTTTETQSRNALVGWLKVVVAPPSRGGGEPTE